MRFAGWDKHTVVRLLLRFVPSCSAMHWWTLNIYRRLNCLRWFLLIEVRVCHGSQNPEMQEVSARELLGSLQNTP